MPTLHPCPECGVLLQRGKGPHKLAHHGCVTISDATRRELVQRVDALASSEFVSELAARDMMHRLILAKATEDGVTLSELTNLYSELRGPKPKAAEAPAPAVDENGPGGMLARIQAQKAKQG